mgnify:CR=1 FL=1
MAKNSILLIGLGYFGRKVAEKLSAYHQDVMAVDAEEERVNDCLSFVTNGRIGDTTNPEFVKSLGVRDYDLCIVTIGDDFLSSLQTTSLLKEEGARYVVSRASSDMQEKFLLRNGADQVIFPEKTYAEWTAVRYAANHIFDYIPLEDGYAIMEIEMPPRWVGKTIRSLNVRTEYRLNVIACKRDGVMRPNFNPDEVLDDRDQLLVMGRSADIRKCFR